MPLPLLRAPIVYDVPGAMVHCPMVAVTINGVATMLILDTGSTDHVLTVDLARRANLPMQPGEDGTDAAGVSVQSWMIGRLPATVGNVTLTLDDVVAFNGPEPFEGWGVGGFLSPQHLHRTATVILDLLHAELTIVAGDPAEIGERLIERLPDLRPIWLDRQAGDTTVLVRAAIDPHPDVVTLLDSGGKATEFTASAVPGLVANDPQTSGRGVSGTEVRGSVAADQQLRVGDAIIPVPRLFVRPAVDDAPRGLVGMDVMRGTVLMVGSDLTRFVLWLVPR